MKDFIYECLKTMKGGLEDILILFGISLTVYITITTRHDIFGFCVSIAALIRYGIPEIICIFKAILQGATYTTDKYTLYTSLSLIYIITPLIN